jgi:hypothetical protein
MDEEDVRLASEASKFGPSDAPSGARPQSLRSTPASFLYAMATDASSAAATDNWEITQIQLSRSPISVHLFSSEIGSDCGNNSTHEEKHHENLPGK